MIDQREHRLMITSDIERYGDRNDGDQVRLQRILKGVLDVAAVTAGLEPDEWKRQPQGDGEFTVLPSGTDVPTVLELFVTALAENIASVNRGRFRLRMRLAVHHGPIHVDGAAGSPGGHAVQSGRMVGADALRAAMAACPEADLGVIVSERVFDDYVGQGYGGPSIEEFRFVRAKDKSDEYRAYLHLPGHNVHRLRELDPYDTEPGVSEGSGKAQDSQGGDGRSAGRDLNGGNIVSGDNHGGLTMGGDNHGTAINGGEHHHGDRSGVTNHISGNSTAYSAGRDGYFGDVPRRRRPSR
ncbi:hypothetical protein ACFYSC_29190 [Streptosporangium sp. NPDC004379]|uniref:hypothetical protein n=1 Tax=Streptosporangium sp. NPDC004379 TaxID=3366189 RepID=UPI00367E77A2